MAKQKAPRFRTRFDSFLLTSSCRVEIFCVLDSVVLLLVLFFSETMGKVRISVDFCQCQYNCGVILFWVKEERFEWTFFDTDRELLPSQQHGMEWNLFSAMNDDGGIKNELLFCRGSIDCQNQYDLR